MAPQEEAPSVEVQLWTWKRTLVFLPLIHSSFGMGHACRDSRQACSSITHGTPLVEFGLQSGP